MHIDQWELTEAMRTLQTNHTKMKNIYNAALAQGQWLENTVGENGATITATSKKLLQINLFRDSLRNKTDTAVCQFSEPLGPRTLGVL